ncbi:MAG: TIGR03564 family F420-dependent LLM class oxidoreductase [Actinomycetia bacterium]|nr:TIGR03564 family F420-dependent LLM class oxidoreductase [Actinomycetes bacterium]
MRIGLNATALVAKASVAAFVEHARTAEADGFDSYWVAEHPTGGFDALTVLTVVGQTVETMELGTAVIPTYPRHPMVLAGQAMTAQSAMQGRLTLGIGLSHQPMMAELGMLDDKPIRHLRDYLSVLVPLMEQGRVDFQGQSISCRATVLRPAERPPPILVAALGPQALRVAGGRTAGTSLAWVGPNTIRDHIVPRIREAAAAAGRNEPRVVATLPICVTDDPAGIRSRISANATMYTQLPSYQAMFEREGVSEPGELGLVGSEAEVEEMVAGLAEAGVTDFSASEFTPSPDERERTRALLKQLAAAN